VFSEGDIGLLLQFSQAAVPLDMRGGRQEDGYDWFFLTA
jgi:hypothetical protein